MYEPILQTIYKKYYQDFAGHSSITSSHWQKIGSHAVSNIDGQWVARGAGFGNFLERSLKNKIIHAPEIYLSLGLLKHYHCPDRIIQAGKNVAFSSQRLCEFDCVKQMLSLFEIVRQQNIDLTLKDPLTKGGFKVACVIGDGYGFFTLLLKALDPEIRVITVNLGRTLFFDVLFCQKGLPEEKTHLLTPASRGEPLVSLNFCEAEQYQLLKGLPVDLFVNIASMQEMSPLVIASYFDYMGSSSAPKVYFYCCNRREKVLPDGTVTRFSDYPWNDAKIILDELCPWYQKFPVSMPPYWKPFDGPTQHRFVKIK